MRRYRVTNPLYGNGPTAGLRPGQTRNLRLSDRGRAKMESAGVVVECITPHRGAAIAGMGIAMGGSSGRFHRMVERGELPFGRVIGYVGNCVDCCGPSGRTGV
jgi:hypothetical protein